MLNLNDDMDDLIRQAADEYPLKIDGKDWDKVLAGMQQSVVQTQPVNNKKYWWLLLLLLPLLIAIPMYYHKNEIQQPDYVQTKTASAATEQQHLKDAITDKPDKASESEQAATDKAFSSSPTQKADNNIRGNKPQEARNFNEITTNNSNHITATGANRKSGEDISKNNSSGISNSVLPDVNGGQHNAINNNNEQAVESGVNIPDRTKKETNEKVNTSTTALDSSNTYKTTPATQKDSAITNKTSNLKHTTPIKTKGLYIGIAAGLDASTVKMHRVEKLGYTASFIFGYRINNNLSVESGLMWDNKNYYSPGKYFDRSRTNIPPTSYIHYLDGTCRMYEVPLNVKYDFNSRKLSGFYVSAGLSSYIMKKENYEYYATNNGNDYIGKRKYKNSTNNLFSVANINGGYQFIFKNNSSLRIEPYLKVPLKGLGIGKLPFASTGISAAYTLPLH